MFFLIVDRLYQFYRFGSFTNTYVSLFAKEQRLADPSLPGNFPWSTPFLEGVLVPLFKPEKSIFLFDPLLILAIVLLFILWRRLSPVVRAYGLTSLMLLLGYICFYARYTYWAGDFAWGDRYVSTSVELAALLAVPLLVRYRAELSVWVWRSALAVIAVSLAIQLASLAFWLPLEIYQMENGGASHVRDCLAFQKYRRIRFGQDAGVGIEQRIDDTRSMGFCAYYDLELPAILVAASWGCACVGSRDTAFTIWGAGVAGLLLVSARIMALVSSEIPEGRP